MNSVDYESIALEVRVELCAVYATAIPSFRFEPSKKTNFYYYYPFLFWEAFPGVTCQDAKTIAISGRLYLDHICTLDAFIDDFNPRNGHLPLLSALLHERALILIASLFPSSSEFWQHLWRFHQEFAGAVLVEKRSHFGRVQAYEDNEFFRLAKGKSALSKAAIAALAVLNGTPEKMSDLCASQDYFNAALQMFDDIKDWKIDFKKQRFSYLITRGVIEAGLTDVADGSSAVIDRLGRHLYYSGTMEAAIDLASEWSELAIAGARGHHVDAWVHLCQDLKSRIGHLKDDFGLIRARTVLRSDPERQVPKGSDMIASAAQFILDQRGLGYPEALHAMSFALPDQVNSAGHNHTGIVFQRAIVTDVLLDLRDAGLFQCDQAIDEEIHKLVEARLRDVPGGWSYFPTLRDLPPDADDLGQILQVLVRGGYSQTRPLVEEPIRMLFEKCAHPDGSFDTWILDPGATDPVTLAMAASIRTSWGSGPDVEVIANMAYGLTIYDPHRFEREVEGAVTYVETRQQPAGNWIPSWYSSSYYGTYVVARLLTATRPDSLCLAKVWEFLLSAQRSDGGFGDRSSTPLETALAMLTWSLRLDRTNGSPNLATEALRYLELTCAEDGSWDPTPFIKMETDRATRPPGTRSRRVLTYKSRTISTAYVLKSLLVLQKEASCKPQPALRT